MTDDRTILRGSRLFAGLDDIELDAALAALHSREARYDKGQLVLGPGQAMTSCGFVLEGRVQTLRTDINGDKMLLAQVEPGGSFGEALHYLQQQRPLYIQALSASRLLWLNFVVLDPALPLSAMLQQRLLSLLAARTLEMNDRIHILVKKGLREKLIAFLSLQADQPGQSFSINLDRHDMAAYLGVDRSALSRELARMRDEGLLRFDKNSFELLDAQLFNDV